MSIGLKIIFAIIIGVGCVFYVRASMRSNIKNKAEFRHASFFKKIDMVFSEDDDLLNANKWWDIIGMLISLVLLGYLIISSIKEIVIE